MAPFNSHLQSRGHSKRVVSVAVEDRAVESLSKVRAIVVHARFVREHERVCRIVESIAQDEFERVFGSAIMAHAVAVQSILARHLVGRVELIARRRNSKYAIVSGKNGEWIELMLLVEIVERSHAIAVRGVRAADSVGTIAHVLDAALLGTPRRVIVQNETYLVHALSLVAERIAIDLVLGEPDAVGLLLDLPA